MANDKLVPLITKIIDASADRISKVAAEQATQAAIKTWEIQRKAALKEISDKRLYNTKLLLRNYRLFKTHSAEAIFSRDRASESVQELLDMMWDCSNGGYSETFVDSIRRSAARTALIIDHVDEMIGIYKIFCERSSRPEDMRRFRVLNALYLEGEPKTAAEVAAGEMIDSRTVYKDIDAACEKLTALFFGATAIR